MKRILGIGNALVDVVVLMEGEYILQEFGLPKGSMQLVDKSKSEGIKKATEFFPRTWIPGGSAANTIHGLAMLGVDTGFIGCVGQDDTGKFFEDEMKKAGVNTYLLHGDSPTGTSVALISRDSERTMATHLGAASELTADKLLPDFFKNYDILYLEGYLINDFEFIDKACRMAKENNMIVSIDLASYNVVDGFLDSFKKIVKEYVDILFANELEAHSFTGLEVEQALESLSGMSDIAVVKTGAAGSLVRSGREVKKISPVAVQCIDTTGAGDLYAAGFLYGYASGMDLEKCGSIGSLMAGKVIETLGARMEKDKFEGIRKEIGLITESK